MPYDITLAAQNTSSKGRVLRQVADHRKFGTVRPLAKEVAAGRGADTRRRSGTPRSLANEVAPSRGADTQPIEPMLLVYRERAETFHLIAVALRRGYEAFALVLEA